MATTTNYAWETPDDTDLVKDGAAAIRTLGSSVDTTTKALNPSTTLGDIEYRSSTANTNTRLGIGTTGQVLTVVGGVPAWSTSAGGKVLQVVSTQTTTTTTIASTTLTDTGITATITPTLSTSKILVIIAANPYGSAAVDNTQVGAALLRGATTLQSWDTGKSFLVLVGGGSQSYIAANNSVVYLDSPATTSATTYKLQANVQSTANGRQVVFQGSGAPGTITLMEIGV
jgi:hypothetical protein